MRIRSTFALPSRARKVVITAASGAAIIAGVGMGVTTSAVTASPAAAATPPGQCLLQFMGVNSSGAIVKRTYNNGKITSHTYNPGRLGFVPRGMVGTGVGGRDFLGEGYVANSKDGNFYGIGVSAKTSYNDVVITKKSLNKTWRSIRSLTAGYNTSPKGNSFIYGLTDSNALYRYEFDGGAPHTRATVGTYGWTLNTITADRSGVVPGTNRKADVLVATSKGGQLIEYTVPVDKPAQWSRKTLKGSTWGNFKALKTSRCYDPNTGARQPGRIMIGIVKNGDVYLYFDKNATDGSGADIVGYGKIASGWTETIYS